MIKKISVITAIAMLVSSSAFAENITMASSLTSANTGKTVYGTKTGTATADSPLIGKTSSGVGIGLYTNSQGYSVVTQHTNGTKAYGTSYDSTSIFSHDVTKKGTAYLEKPTAITTTDFAAWSTM